MKRIIWLNVPYAVILIGIAILTFVCFEQNKVIEQQETMIQILWRDCR